MKATSVEATVEQTTIATTTTTTTTDNNNDEKEGSEKVVLVETTTKQESTVLLPTFATLCSEVDLDVRLRKAVARLGYIRPTLVQTQCLRLAINSGRDLLVRARTGSGKTLAYSLPVLNSILKQHNDMDPTTTTSGGGGGSSIKAVILVPTRELCEQVHTTLRSLIYYCDEIVSIAVLGAASSSTTTTRNQGSHSTTPKSSNRSFLVTQEAMLRDNPNIIIATPAALLRYIRTTPNNSSRNSSSSIQLSLKNVSSLVIDEADLVLSFGYSLQQDILDIIRALPNIYQGYLMSATLTSDVQALKKVVLHSPAILKLEEGDEDPNRKGGRNKQLAQFYLTIPKNDKELVLYVFLKLGLLKGKGLFFVNTTDGGYRLKLFLEQFHIRSAVLNAELPLLSRMSIIDQFNAGNFDYLIATDESSTMKKKPTTTAASVEGENDITKTKGEEEPKKKKKMEKPTKTTTKRIQDDHYGVSRGIDFQGVSFVVNVDFPLSVDSYIHRIGRTARGGAKGVALSFVERESEEQRTALTQVQASQPPVSLATVSASGDSALTAAAATESTVVEETYTNPPFPLDFNLNEIEGFRYRVEDVRRAVTSIAIKEARAAELKAELLNSESLQSHFALNPADLQLLRHDRQATHVTRIQDHLKHVPKYLLPNGMQVADMSKSKKKRKRARAGMNGGKTAPNMNNTDPLKKALAGSTSITLDGVIDTNDPEEVVKAELLSATNQPKRSIYMDDEFGPSTSGRNAWKQRHKKGKYSNKRRRKEN